MTKKIYLDTSEKCPGSVYFPLLLFTKQHHKNDIYLFKEYWKVKQQNGTLRI